MKVLGWLSMAGRIRWHLIVNDGLGITKSACGRYQFAGNKSVKGESVRSSPRDVPPMYAMLCKGCTASKYARGTV